jgi:tRNA (mo5U34)-methyltransferase
MNKFTVSKNAWTQSELDTYKWYHCMQFDNDTETYGWKDNKTICDWILEKIITLDVNNKVVSDIGCRDGLLSFTMEKMGATEIIGVDNNISIGTTELIIPRMGSKVQMVENNLYNLEYLNKFDVTICCGVLYHLRFPFLGLKKLVDMTKPGGSLYIEGGFLVNPELENYSLCGCTSFSNSPYEGSSPIFFNKQGLIDTMSTFGCKYISHHEYGKHRKTDGSNILTDRLLFTFERTELYDDVISHLNGYWYNTHILHN